MGTQRADLESWQERAAHDLCTIAGVDPWECVPDHPGRRFRGFERDYFMNWARETITEALDIKQAIASAAIAGDYDPRI